MAARIKGDVSPLFIKVGVALALSLAGFLFSRFKTRKIRPVLAPPPSSSSDHEESDTGWTKRHSTTDFQRLAEKHDDICAEKNSIGGITISSSQSREHSGNREGFLLPEFNNLVEDLNLRTSDGLSMKKDLDIPKSNVETLTEPRSTGKDDYEQEIKHLRNMVRLLRVRERDLQVELLEYYGLKEQEAAVLELQNRLKINATETKLLRLKIDSLLKDNQRLKAQLNDFAKVNAELESAKEKITFLKKKLLSEAEQNRLLILDLQKRVVKLQNEEQKNVEGNLEIESKLQRLMELEGEVQELRNSNLKLEVENSELTEKLESAQQLASSAQEEKELTELKRTSECLRQENEDLLKKIDRLQADRCSDAEELVYLRWLNACLRYELRNYQPPPGKTVARDLSKSMSPRSEEKAKKLILEYARTEGLADQGINFIDFDPDHWSFFSTSLLSHSGEFDDLSVDNTSSTKNKHKFLKKLRRLIKGKDSDQHKHNSSVEKAGYSDSDSPGCSSTLSTVTDLGMEGHSNSFRASSQTPSSKLLDIRNWKIQKEEDTRKPPRLRRYSDLGSYELKTSKSSREGGTWITEERLSDQNLESRRKSDLVKYAAALEDSHSRAVRYHRKSASATHF